MHSRLAISIIIFSIIAFPLGCDSGGSNQEEEETQKAEYEGSWVYAEDKSGGAGFDGILYHYLDFSEESLTYRRTNSECRYLDATEDADIESYDSDENSMTLSSISEDGMTYTPLREEVTVEVRDTTLHFESVEQNATYSESDSTGTELDPC